MEGNDAGTMIESRLKELAEAGGGSPIWRPSYSKSYIAAGSLIKKWLAEEGFEVYEDPVGNIYGRIEGSEAGTILCGSHLDTVKNGGRYDGAVGIVTAILSVKENVIKNGVPKKNIEVVALVEEEGSRFASSYIGSRAITGRLSEADLNEIGVDGKTLRDAIMEAGLGGYTVSGLTKTARRDIDAFLELHIEQGPFLEKKNVEIGIVKGIVGVYSYEITIKGQQNHAGTTPMDMRLDPVVAASNFIRHMTMYCRKASPTATFTVGGITATPGLSNVIADSVNLVLDFRDGVEGAIDEIETEIYRKAEALHEKGFSVGLSQLCHEAPSSLDRHIVEVIESAAVEVQKSYIKMNSGAGHDSQVFSEKFPTGMIFIPSRKGISHSAEEFTKTKDLTNGEEVLERVIYKLAY